MTRPDREEEGALVAEEKKKPRVLHPKGEQRPPTAIPGARPAPALGGAPAARRGTAGWNFSAELPATGGAADSFRRTITPMFSSRARVEARGRPRESARRDEGGPDGQVQGSSSSPSSGEPVGTRGPGAIERRRKTFRVGSGTPEPQGPSQTAETQKTARKAEIANEGSGIGTIFSRRGRDARGPNESAPPRCGTTGIAESLHTRGLSCRPPNGRLCKNHLQPDQIDRRTTSPVAKVCKR